MKTKVFDGKHEGTKAVWEIDDEGEKVGNFPIVSMRKKKFKAILEHADELKEFVEE